MRRRARCLPGPWPVDVVGVFVARPADVQASVLKSSTWRPPEHLSAFGEENKCFSRDLAHEQGVECVLTSVSRVASASAEISRSLGFCGDLCKGRNRDVCVARKDRGSRRERGGPDRKRSYPQALPSA